MPGQSSNDYPGKVVFYVTLAAMVVFFWWLLIYDHGVVSAH